MLHETPIAGAFTPSEILDEANRLLASQRSIISLNEFIAVHDNAVFFLSQTKTLIVVVLRANFQRNPFVCAIKSILRVIDRYKFYSFCAQDGTPSTNIESLYFSTTASVSFRATPASVDTFTANNPSFRHFENELLSEAPREASPFIRKSRFFGVTTLGSGIASGLGDHSFSLGEFSIR